MGPRRQVDRETSVSGSLVILRNFHHGRDRGEIRLPWGVTEGRNLPLVGRDFAVFPGTRGARRHQTRIGRLLAVSPTVSRFRREPSCTYADPLRRPQQIRVAFGIVLIEASDVHEREESPQYSQDFDVADREVEKLTEFEARLHCSARVRSFFALSSYLTRCGLKANGKANSVTAHGGPDSDILKIIDSPSI